VEGCPTKDDASDPDELKTVVGHPERSDFVAARWAAAGASEAWNRSFSRGSQLPGSNSQLNLKLTGVHGTSRLSSVRNRTGSTDCLPWTTGGVKGGMMSRPRLSVPARARARRAWGAASNEQSRDVRAGTPVPPRPAPWGALAVQLGSFPPHARRGMTRSRRRARGRSCLALPSRPCGWPAVGLSSRAVSPFVWLLAVG
jgi:hypothetical protein